MWLVMNARDPYFFSLLAKPSIASRLRNKINEKNNAGWTALMLAARNSRTYSSENTVRLLLNACADPTLQEKTGWTALMMAIGYSKTDSTPGTIKLLLDAIPMSSQQLVNLFRKLGSE